MINQRTFAGTLGLVFTASIALFTVQPTMALDVKLTVRETAGVAREGGVVSCGVPFAKGAVKDLARLTATVDGKPAPAQFQLLAPWDDGSARWALATFAVNVPANGAAAVVISDAAAPAAPKQPVKVESAADAVTVSTGAMKLKLSRKAGPLIAAVEVDGKPVLGAGGLKIVLYTATGEAVVAGPPAEVVVEQSGPMQAVVAARGLFPGLHNGLLGYAARFTVTAGGKAVNVRLWLENNGAHGYNAGRAGKADPEWFSFDGLAVEAEFALGEQTRAACEGATAAKSLAVVQKCPAAKWDNFAFTVTADGTEQAKGKRTDGVLTLSGPAGRCTAAIRHFWQNYDKSAEWDNGQLKLWLWPRDGQWPRAENLGGGGQTFLKDANITRPGLYNLPGGVHKGHEFVLDFSGQSPAQTSAELASPLVAADADYFAATEAANGLFAPATTVSGDEELDWKYRFWRNMAGNLVDPAAKGGLEQVRTVAAERGSVWFGWMDFGDVCSPHGGWYSGCVSPRNLHHDWVWAVLIQYLRTGNPAFLELGSQMARHQIDIDQNWSDRDPPGVRALLRPDGPTSETHSSPAAPGPQQNWLSGIVLYYMLTGDASAKEAALRNYQGMQEAIVEILKTRPTDNVHFEASTLTIQNLMSLHAMTGDAKFIDDIKTVFTGHLLRRYRDAGPFFYEPRMEIRQQDYHMLGQQFCRGLQTLIEYHYRTGDERIGKILAEACETEFPDTFYEAPLYLADLYGYVGYMTGNADLLTRGIDSFADAFPESRNPPVYRLGQEDWTERTAIMLRTGNTLQHVIWKSKGPGRPALDKGCQGPALAPRPGSKGMFPAEWTTPGDPELAKPQPQPDGSMLLDVKGFALRDCDIAAQDGARGGKMVVLRQFTSAATGLVALKAGKYELIIQAFAPTDDNDAFNVTIDGDFNRVVPRGLRQIVPTGTVRFTVEKDKTVQIRINASEENGMSVDCVLIRPAK